MATSEEDLPSEGKARKDTQTIELIGRHRLATEILQAGLEVAFPTRDRGIDLIVYLDLDRLHTSFEAVPLQMKASSKQSFGIWRKYLRINNLHLAYVWNVDGEGPADTFVMKYADAVAIGEQMEWTSTKSWIEGGGYSTRGINARLASLLEPYRMTPDKWWSHVLRIPKSAV